ncbi:MAG TPA: FHA domain-containing protein [Kofleriaceae bacterium]|jgi:pSer/pThr/pTyr-binding forkhead associated (FHA) protein
MGSGGGMQPIQVIREVAAGLAQDEFEKRYPDPFLILDAAALRAVDRRLADGKTIDRLVLSGPASRQGELLVASLVARNSGERVVTIGTSPQCDISIDDASISKQHAFFDRAGDTWRLWDNDSAAGTFVNDKPVVFNTPRPLTPGDYITLGTVDLTFLTSPLFYGFARQL